MGFVQYTGTDSPHFELVKSQGRQESIVIYPGEVQQHDDKVCTYLLTNEPTIWATASSLQTTIDQYDTIKTTAGAPTGTPGRTSGRLPMIFDTVNNKLWIYNGGWKGAVVS